MKRILFDTAFAAIITGDLHEISQTNNPHVLAAMILINNGNEV